MMKQKVILWNGNEIDVNQIQEGTTNNENSNWEETMSQEEQNQDNYEEQENQENQEKQEEADTTDKIFIVVGSILSVIVLGIVGIRIWKEKEKIN